MATIPSPDAIGFNTPQGAGQVIRAPSLQMYLPNQAGVTAENARDVQRRVDDEELSKATVQFQLAQMSELEKFEENQDIDKASDDYNAAIDEQMGKAAANISNGQARNAFLENITVPAEESKYKVGEKAFAKIRDRERGYMSSAFAQIVKGAKNLEYGDPATAGVALQLTSDSMVERGMMTNVEAQDTIRTAQNDIALGRLKAMRPDQQLEILNNMEADGNMWADRVPPEVRKVLKASAETELATTMAMDFAHEMATQPTPPDRFQADLQIYKEFKDAPDYLRDDLIKNARLEYGQLMNNRKMGETEAKLATYSNIDLKVRDPMSGITLAQLNQKGGPYHEQWQAMDPAQRSNLESYMTNKANGTVLKTSDREVYHTLRTLFTAGPDKRTEAIDYFMKNNAKLTDTDFKFWDKELINGTPTGLFNHQTRLLALTEKMPWKDQAALLDGLDRWYTGFQTTHDGAPPTDADVATQIRKSIQTQVSSTGILGLGLIGTGEDYPYSKDTEELVETFETLLADAENPQGVSEFMSNYAPEQQEEIRYTYMRKKDPTLLADVIADRKAANLPTDLESVQADFAKLYALRQKK